MKDHAMTMTRYLISIFAMVIGSLVLAVGLLLGAIIWSGKPIEFTSRNSAGRIVALTPGDGEPYWSYARTVTGGAILGGGAAFLFGWWFKRRVDASGR
jgi:hypothetical protein